MSPTSLPLVKVLSNEILIYGERTYVGIWDWGIEDIWQSVLQRTAAETVI